MAAAEITNADAIHPGYGFLAENAKFSQICADHEIKFIGPTPDMINSMGDKVTAKETMIRAGVPVVPGGEGLLQSYDHAVGVAREIGYPVMMKATAGGGGKGMRLVWEESELERAYNSAKAEAAASFKNDGLYMEKFVEEPRHIEIQIAGDQFGNVCHLSERDCSIQRRHQKLVEESPSPFMTDELRARMGEAARKAASAINYESVGTVEFLVDKHRNFYFMEMNTRIQVEHCVTEEVINFDLIKEQIKIAMGGAFSGKDPSKVDRSAAYATRHIAKNLVAAGVASEVLVQVSYAIGVAKPTSINVNTYGTAKVDLNDGQIAKIVEGIFDMRPYFIEQRLKLRSPIYSETAAYGHMGRIPEVVEKTFTSPDGKSVTRKVELFTWEKLDYVSKVKKAFGLK